MFDRRLSPFDRLSKMYRFVFRLSAFPVYFPEITRISESLVETHGLNTHCMLVTVKIAQVTGVLNKQLNRYIGKQRIGDFGNFFWNFCKLKLYIFVGNLGKIIIWSIQKKNVKIVDSTKEKKYLEKEPFFLRANSTNL